MIQRPKIWLVLALGLGLVTDWLFYGKALGVSLLIFTMVLLIGLTVMTLLENRPFLRRNIWLIVPLLFFATMGMVRANSFLTFLNVSGTLYLLALLVYFYTADSPTRPGLLEYVQLPLRVFGGMVARPWAVIGQALDFDGTAVRTHSSSVAPVVRGTVLATPVLIIFALLLASADVIFANTLRNLFSFELGFDPLEIISHTMIVIASGWVLGGGVLYALRHHKAVKATVPEKIMLTLADRLPLGIVEASTILGLINILFGSFVAIQFVYLFGGLRNIELDGFSYSGYARQGYFELITVAVLTLGLILLLNWFTRRSGRKQTAVFNSLSTLMIGFVLVMLVSAFKRMNLYEWVYGFTELRLYVYVSMTWLALVLLWFVVTLWLRPDRFAIGVLVAGLGFVATLNMVNPDAFIVQQNVARFEQVGYLDVEYLGTLSADAVPGLIEVTALVSDDNTVTAVDCGRYSGNRATASAPSTTSCLQMTDPNYLHDNLQNRLQYMGTDDSMWQWQAYHIGRMRAYQALQRWHK